MRRLIFENCHILEQPVVGDDRGKLVAVEGQRSVPFDIARVYYIFGTEPGAERGVHAHRDLHQWATCVSGSCVLTVDNGRERHEVTLDSPEKGLHIRPMIWRKMRNFSEGAVLLVLASAAYDQADYIRNYGTFLSLTGGGAAK